MQNAISNLSGCVVCEKSNVLLFQKVTPSEASTQLLTCFSLARQHVAFGVKPRAAGVRPIEIDGLAAFTPEIDSVASSAPYT
jgi:hypothetical protein